LASYPCFISKDVFYAGKKHGGENSPEVDEINSKGGSDEKDWRIRLIGAIPRGSENAGLSIGVLSD
jgi:hypothetical protein